MQSILDCNTHLSKEEFTKRVCTFLRPVSRKYNKLSGYERLKNVTLDIERYARWNEEDGIGIPYSWTSYALRWAYSSLRLPQDTEMALDAMNVRKLVELVHTCNEQCPTQGDVLHYLCENIYTSERSN